VTVPKPRRDPLHLRAEELRAHFSRAYYDPQFQALLQRFHMTTNSLLDDETIFQFNETILSTRVDKNPARAFQDDLAVIRRLGQQWDAGEIVDSIARAVAPQRGSQRGYLGITKLDLYANQSRYVFGLAAQGGNCGVLSYRRYTSAILNEPPDRERLKQRTLKQALSSTGLLFGLPRCTDPTCARAYANSLPEHDAKQLKLCSACQKGFADYFRNLSRSP
jgi:predicted Zn-dependent protease